MANIDIGDLSTFLIVAEDLSFTRAAERLNVDQSALSRRVAGIEARIGMKLFERTTRQVRLTGAGAALKREAPKVLAQLETALTRARRAEEGAVGEIRIGYNDFAISGPLPQIVQAFRSTVPDVHVSMVRSGTETQMARLAAGEIDVAFGIGPVSDARFDVACVWRESLVAVMAETHPLARRKALSLAETVSEPLVIGDRSRWQVYRNELRRVYATVGAFPDIVAEGPDTSVVMGLVASGIGITIYPECVENAARSGIVLCPIIDAGASLQTDMAWQSGADPVTDRFAALAQDYVRRWPDGRYRDSNVTPLATAPRKGGR
ncbi:transcriptional regulator, LysR family [Roseovarius nanhaiticus]|uniref:Transcriptional regulator, LysR family n=1 Tax=Roseovarius nanhaiticus TaxID=573024 RepID=A0A1N7HMZ7_9RHOB|nr:LysR family transcriptional regulator [Roseovarius nanhaiticus]SEL36457.1 transcriptional regulator, LysR family [Roseovarius nanhaiticus]SIS26255.1 transcriptional regulator, LysR family [Roseovarius nanhaiticus]